MPTSILPGERWIYYPPPLKVQICAKQMRSECQMDSTLRTKIQCACHCRQPHLPGINCHSFFSSALFQFNSCPAGQHLCPYTPVSSGGATLCQGKLVGQLCPEVLNPLTSRPRPTCVTCVSVEPWRSAQAQISDTNLHIPYMGITSTSAAAS